jgi:hypothetical protein
MPSMDRTGTPAGVRRTAVVLAMLYVLDSWCAGQGVWSLAVSFAGVVALGIGALVALLRGRRPWATSRAVRALIYVVLAVTTVATVRFHGWMAEARANQVVEACKAYHARHGGYPARLADLVPEFLASVPRAKYTMMWGEFSYWTSSLDAHTLMYVAAPPFGRRLYNFEAGRWGQLD